jgi:hypothetical protein
MENELYQILKKHNLPLKKREEVLADLLLLLGVVGQSEQLVCYTCNCSKGNAPEGDNFCNMCDHYF